MPSNDCLDIAYLNCGSASGVTDHISEGLASLGHHLQMLQVSGPLEPRDEHGRRRWSWQLGMHLAVSALRFGPREAIGHRWNTTYAFDVHSRRAGALLTNLPRPPDVVLQNGALYAPGAPPPYGYVLLLDHTRALSMEGAGHHDRPPLDYGTGWRERETAVYRGARAIATFSRRVSKSLQRDYNIQEKRIHVVGAGANVYPHELERRDDGKTILFVGKDFRRKGGEILLRAFERLRRQRPALKLVIAGPPERLELPEGAVNRGYVPPEALAELFAQATVFALPTLREPFGIAFLDAMACGVPCVGTTIEAIPEIVEDQVTGLLVPPGDDAALASALLRLLDDPAGAHAMGLRGRLRVDSGFRWSDVARRMEEALFAAVGRAAPPISTVPDVA